MVKSYKDLHELEVDALKEIANIGTGNAINALHRMTRKDIMIDLPKIHIISYQDAPDLLGGQEQVATGVLLEISGDINGMFMFLLSEEFTAKLIPLLGLIEEELYGELKESAIQEIGNIMCCCYLNAIYKITGLNMMTEIPDSCTDMIGALLSIPMIRFAKLEDTMLFMETRIHFDGDTLPCHILFLPELQSLQRLMEALGL